MKYPAFSFQSSIAESRLFRMGSLFLYATLLLQTALLFYQRHLPPSASGVLGVGGLTILFIVALYRAVQPGAHVQQPLRLASEFLLAIACLLLLGLYLPVLPWPWLIGMAALLPLALEGAWALLYLAAIALVGIALSAVHSVPPGVGLPLLAASLLAGGIMSWLASALQRNREALHAAQSSAQRYAAIIGTSRHTFLIADAQMHIRYASPAVQDLIGYTPEEIANQQPWPAIHADDVQDYQAKIQQLRDSAGSTLSWRYRLQHRAGHWVWIESRGHNLLHDPAVNGLLFCLENISGQQQLQEQLAEQQALLRTILDLNPEMIYAKDTAGRFTISNRNFQRRFGYASEDELRGKTIYQALLTQVPQDRELAAFEVADRIHSQDLQVMASGEIVEEMELPGFLERDKHKWYSTNKYPLRNIAGETIGLLGVVRDITDRKGYQVRLEHQALHDSLTGLPNQRYLMTAIGNAIAQFKQDQAPLAALLCDLDFFKSINNMHGHEFGDKCLPALTRRILMELPPTDLVTRFGSDDFMILLPNTSVAQARVKAQAILTALAYPLVIGETVVKIQASIGIAPLGPEHHSPSDLIRDTDAAMRQAKEHGRNRVELYDPLLQGSAARRARMDVALRFALERHELTLVYQPQISLIDGRLQGFEVLLRWDSPQYGAISPNEFIPVAEASGLVVPIGSWALEQACLQLRRWRFEHPHQHGLTLAVNVSMRQLLQPTFLSEVTALLENNQIPPECVELELTESSAMANPQQTIETLSQLKKLGLRLALDDFGTGYSSLAYLQKLPLDVLKIDQAFVRGLGTSRSDAEIVSLILALAKTLDLEAIAEGVETEAHIAELSKLGCYLGQGFLFSVPVTADAAARFLAPDYRFSRQ